MLGRVWYHDEMDVWSIYVDVPHFRSQDEAFAVRDALDALVIDGGCAGAKTLDAPTTEIYFQIEADDALAAQAEGARLARAILDRAGLASDFEVYVQRDPAPSGPR